ncbi:MAG: class I SAM-dependent methyltransferase [Anaerolineae bacterium]|nr:class I SAM-dependent methyltransferase [Anaerolineae bacterium]
MSLPGVHLAPNIQGAPDIYEIENIALDPEGLIEMTMWAIAPWQDRIVVDVGAGTGYHIPRFHALAAHVIAVEPHDDSRLQAMARVARLGLPRASVMTGSAERLLLPDQSVDILHARFAYFFAPRCAPGLAEVARVMRPGGTAFIIDNDLRSGTFASWLARIPGNPNAPADVVEEFWRDQGFNHERIISQWRFQTRADLEAVVRLEFGEALGAELIAEHSGLSVEYHYALYWKTYSA